MKCRMDGRIDRLDGLEASSLNDTFGRRECDRHRGIKTADSLRTPPARRIAHRLALVASLDLAYIFRFRSGNGRRAQILESEIGTRPRRFYRLEAKLGGRMNEWSL